MPISDVLDYGKMSKFLSLQEQANMLTVQNLEPFGCGLAKDSDTPRYEPCFEANSIGVDTSITGYEMSFRLNTQWVKSIGDSDNANNNALKKSLENASRFAYSETTKEEVLARFNPSNIGPQKHSQPFITYDVERDVVLVVIYPAFFTAATYENNTLALLKAVLEVLYAYNSYASVCKTPYFRKYLEKLT